MYDQDDSYQYSSRSSTPGLTPGLLDGFPPTFSQGGSGSSFSESSDSWASERYSSPHPFRYNSKATSGLGMLQRPVQGPDMDCRQCAFVKHNNVVLTTEIATLKDAYNALLDVVRPALSHISADHALSADASLASAPLAISVPLPPALKQSDYPNIPFWHLHEWVAHENSTASESNTEGPQPRGSTRASQGINVTMLYVTSAEGIAIDGFRAGNIRGLAIKLFVGMAARGVAPLTWTQGSLQGQRAFSAEICKHYPEMALCDNDWKVQKMAKNMYSSWHKGNVRNSIKLEADNSVPPLKGKKKRSLDSDDAVESDRKRTKDISAPAGMPFIDNSTVIVTVIPDGKEDAETPVAAEASSAPLQIINPLLVTPPVTAAAAPLQKTVPPAAIFPMEILTISGSLTAPPASTPSKDMVPTTTESNPQIPATISPAVNAHVTSTQAADTPILPNSEAPREPAKGAKETKATPSSSKTPRNLCMADWCKGHPGGYLSTFKAHWAIVESSPELEIWKKASDNASASKSKAAAAYL
ncbi:hypothetical protein DFH07DRAFT_764299 [Mycena maculata]|uniref:Uncharacterized protein n=1 Tax=Mycena maculata TaxID=230809 RepID=A0AAD7KEQ8_9AGAR|nr:hypothetical protein DFH07DRAFT_764299 [Mycena maculata]